MAGTKNSKKTNASAPRRSPGRPRKDAQKKKAKAEAEQSFMRAEVLIICSFVLSLLLFLSNFHMCGAVGEWLRRLQLGIFGMVGYLFPVLLFAGTGFFMSNRGNRAAMVKLVATAAVGITLCGFSQLLFGEPYAAGTSLLSYYKSAASGEPGGGLLGGALTAVLSHAFGSVGAFLFLTAVLLIGVVCITEKSVVNVVRKGSGKAYQYAKEDLDRRREIHAERQEERRRLREEQRVRGVDLEATRLTEEPGPDGSGAWEVSLSVQPDMGLTDEGQTAGETLAGGDPDGVQTETTAADSLDGSLKKLGADVFTGQIMLPHGYGGSEDEPEDGEEDDSVPFDRDPEIPFDMGREDGTRVFAETADKTAAGADEVDGADVTDAAYPVDVSESGVNYEGFFVPEEPKTVVTAAGKVIETETELLQKKLESKRAEASAESGEAGVREQIEQKKAVPKKTYIFPPVTLLKRSSRIAGSHSEKEYKETAIKLQQTLHNFGVGVTVTNISCGPAVTRYELHPEQGVKVSKIVGLADDIKLSLAAEDIRIEAPIPGKSAVGIEVPNKENSVVLLRDLLESDNFKKHPSRLAFAVGKDIGGQVVVADIAKMPHLLIAGATGSGKSVCINTLIMSIIYKSSPEDVKLIMVDPKVVELSVYNGIPHLLIPVVTDPKKASGALNWAVAEMTDRYKKFAEYNVRDLKGYNEKLDKERAEAEKAGDEELAASLTRLPQIVIIVDELADLMMVAPGEVEDAICRLAQLARAAGLHLVIATQRPSVNVITGLIKANVPSRIAFSVSSGVDSRTIIDMNGAEKLLGKGDMLFYPSGFPKPQRVQGAFVSDSEVQQVVDFLTEQGMTTDYNPDVESQIVSPQAGGAADPAAGRDEYFAQAGRFIIEKDKASIGMLQRMFKIGFNRAARIMDQLAEAGVVGEEEGTKPRKVLMTMEEFEQMASNL